MVAILLSELPLRLRRRGSVQDAGHPLLRVINTQADQCGRLPDRICRLRGTIS
jgi:hypothetical protein